MSLPINTNSDNNLYLASLEVTGESQGAPTNQIRTVSSLHAWYANATRWTPLSQTLHVAVC